MNLEKITCQQVENKFAELQSFFGDLESISNNLDIERVRDLKQKFLETRQEVYLLLFDPEKIKEIFTDILKNAVNDDWGDEETIEGWVEKNVKIDAEEREIFIEKNLNLKRSNFEGFPCDIIVMSDLNLSYTPIKQLPGHVYVGGDFLIDNTNINEIPNQTKVGGGFYMRNTPIKKLPHNLEIDGSFTLHGSPVTELPDGLSVGGDIFVDRSLKEEAEKASADTRVKGKVFST